MWEEVKPITLLLEQNNKDGSRFLLYFYSHDYELIKLREATYFGETGEFLGSYSRFHSACHASDLPANYFIERLTKQTTNKLIEYYENSNLFVEYLQ